MKIKKIVSLSPEKYEEKDILEMSKEYLEYLERSKKLKPEPKTFEDWLKTEI